MDRKSVVWGKGRRSERNIASLGNVRQFLLGNDVLQTTSLKVWIDRPVNHYPVGSIFNNAS